ncbi:hypothetical protein NDU88_001696 [Pleurodeles waltl]|uniref:Uncharacterized protein n=1 Tax=Pleurodeles waltl TaxID=8319 RepID=A0AAV7LYD1_PLEWA|nr:hypothetical protein NDU88_001696 [Pleurodeles waltl]
MYDNTRNNRCLQGVVGVPIQRANDAQAGRSSVIPTQEERRTEKRDKGDNVQNGDTTGVVRVPIQCTNDAQAGRSSVIPTQEERKTEKRDKRDNVRNGDTPV